MTAIHPEAKATATVSVTSMRAPVLYTGLSLLLAALLASQLTIGAIAIPLSAIFDILGGNGTLNPAWKNIVMEFRMPRALNAMFSGAALGAAGLMLQTLFRNPLADLFVLGIVQGVRLGSAVLVTLAGVVGNAFLLRHGLLGDVGMATHQQLMLWIPAVMFGLIASSALVKPLNGLLLEERYAAPLGMRVDRIRRMTLLLTAWLSGIVSAL